MIQTTTERIVGEKTARPPAREIDGRQSKSRVMQCGSWRAATRAKGYTRPHPRFSALSSRQQRSRWTYRSRAEPKCSLKVIATSHDTALLCASFRSLLIAMGVAVMHGDALDGERRGASLRAVNEARTGAMRRGGGREGAPRRCCALYVTVLSSVPLCASRPALPPHRDPLCSALRSPPPAAAAAEECDAVAPRWHSGGIDAQWDPASERSGCAADAH